MKMKVLRVLKNKIQCKACKDIIESTDRHDFKWCKCGRVAVDGGHAYLRRVGNIGDITEMSEEEEREIEV
ncbi:MAG: DUF7695 domain-containing protein [Nitrosotalea sp.]